MNAQPHSLTIGETKVTTLNDGHFVLPAEYFANVPEALATAPQVEIGANIWVLRQEGRVFLIDTGSAEALKARFPETGQTWPDVRDIQPTDIVLTHMHADHLGGLADGAAFPKVNIHVSRAEWEYWTNPALEDMVPEDMRPMVQMIQAVASGFAGRVVLHDGDSELAKGVTMVALPGHTPGHSGVRVEDAGQSLVIVGDAIISEALQFEAPEVSYALDGDAAQAVATRRALLSESAAQGTLIAATHFAYPGIGTVEEAGKSFRFIAL